MATKEKQGVAAGRKATIGAKKETDGAEKTAKTAKKTSAGSATRKSDKIERQDEISDKIEPQVEVSDKIERQVEVSDKVEPQVEVSDKIERQVEIGDKTKSFDKQTIQARAYLIWVEEGRPDGRDVEHWLRACEELEREVA